MHSSQDTEGYIKSNRLKLYHFAVDVVFVGSRNHPRYIKISKSEKPDYTLGWIGFLIMIVGPIVAFNILSFAGGGSYSVSNLDAGAFICFGSLFVGLVLVMMGEQKAKSGHPSVLSNEDE